MKKLIAAALILAAVLVLMPVISRFHIPERQAQPVQSGESSLSAALPRSGRTLKIQMNDGSVREMDLNEYLWGVVAAEMPASFRQEALNAQAVAARTYALRKAAMGSENHPDAELCTSYACCQAWKSESDARAGWVPNGDMYADKITAAVAETNNQVVLYNGALIEAVFHSFSSPATMDAVDVWGNDVAYLKSVPSPETEADVEKFHTEVFYGADEFRSVLTESYPDVVLGNDPASWIGATVRTETDSGVRTIVLGGHEFSGARVRTLFNLRSGNFQAFADSSGVTFYVTGFGHGVGLSQYGANKMAEQGSTYRDILMHYYSGTSVETCPPALLGG